MRQFNLPDLGEGLEEAEIVAWYVNEGDHVVSDQPLVSVETDKAVVEVPFSSERPYRSAVRRQGRCGEGGVAIGRVRGRSAGGFRDRRRRDRPRRKGRPRARDQRGARTRSPAPSSSRGSRARAQARRRSQPGAGNRPRRCHYSSGRGTRGQEHGGCRSCRALAGDAARHGATYDDGACRGGADHGDRRGRCRGLEKGRRHHHSARARDRRCGQSRAFA